MGNQGDSSTDDDALVWKRLADSVTAYEPAPSPVRAKPSPSPRRGKQPAKPAPRPVTLTKTAAAPTPIDLRAGEHAGLDRSTRIQMAALCQKLLASKTVILVTHDPRDAQDWLDTAMVLTTESIKGPYQLNEFISDHALIQALDGDL